MDFNFCRFRYVAKDSILYFFEMQSDKKGWGETTQSEHLHFHMLLHSLNGFNSRGPRSWDHPLQPSQEL